MGHGADENLLGQVLRPVYIPYLAVEKPYHGCVSGPVQVLQIVGHEAIRFEKASWPSDAPIDARKEIGRTLPPQI